MDVRTDENDQHHFEADRETVHYKGHCRSLQPIVAIKGYRSEHDLYSVLLI
ncbi:MAG TPA: hypothetical protein VKV29_14485 [Chthonomonas sp.]|uniref:hypothetical protein n=1 Tax=Chthonomonas sp. TaxID=2282153 RepID=UPI002B4B919C|nr:hypothetical protein [Chthonomonas sp.]HLH81476.1 hypothetical protein [Chthonomonas sp.]